MPFHTIFAAGVLLGLVQVGSVGAYPWSGHHDAAKQDQAASYDWPAQKGNSNRTGASEHPVLVDIQRQPPAWQWSDPEPGVLRATPLIDNERNIYLSAVNGRLIKFSPEGSVLWTYRSKYGALPAVPAIMDGLLFAVGKSGWMFAVNMSNGEEVWATRVANFSAGDTQSVTAVGGVVVAAFSSPEQHGSLNNLVIALNSEGRVKWVYKVDPFHIYNFQGASSGDGTLVFMDSSGGAYRLSMDTGKALWVSGIKERSVLWFTTAAAVVGPDNVVYCVSNLGPMLPFTTGVVHAYALSDGRPLWRTNLTLPAYQGVAVGKLAGSHGLSLVLGLGSQPGMPGFPALPWPLRTFHQVLALDAATGAERWRRELPWYEPAAAKGDAERFEARKAALAAGALGDPVCLPDCFAQAVISGDGTAYVGYQDGRLLGQRDSNGDGRIDADGDETVDHQFEDSFQASQAIAPGMFAVTPCGGGLWVWKPSVIHV